jgi:probable addiction module antidote protein
VQRNLCSNPTWILVNYCNWKDTLKNEKQPGSSGTMAEFDPNDLRDNPLNIAAYLNKAFAADDFSIILKALNEVMRAQNVSALARATGLRRDRLYKTFRGDIEPDFSRVLKLLEGFDVQITIKPRKVRRPKPPLPKLGRPKKLR